MLRYLLRLSWPAVESEPALENERFMQAGARFHQLAQQSFSGIANERLERQIEGDELLGWWRSFERFSAGLRGREPNRVALPEITLSAPFGRYRMLAKFDLLWYSIGAVEGQSPVASRFTIYDWKTARKAVERARLSDRLQTRVYPYMLVRAGEALNLGRPVAPESVELIYWFAAFPERVQRFAYDAGRFASDESDLAALLAEIERRAMQVAPLFHNPGLSPPALSDELLEAADAGFPRTPQMKHCAFCVYRSLCDRGESAGLLDDSDADAEPAEGEIHIDLEHIAEIAF